MTYTCTSFEINGRCKDGACKESKREEDIKKKMHCESLVKRLVDVRLSAELND